MTLSTSAQAILFTRERLDTTLQKRETIEQAYSCETISPELLADGDDFFLIYGFLKKAVQAKKEGPLLLIDLDSISQETISKILPTLHLERMEEILCIQTSNKPQSEVKNITQGELLSEVITPQLIYFPKIEDIKIQRFDPDLLSLSFWDLLISTVKQISLCRYDADVGYSENIIESYKRHLVATNHKDREELPDTTNEWGNVRTTLYTRVLYKHEELFRAHALTLLQEQERKQSLLKIKLATKKSECKHLEKRNIAAQEYFEETLQKQEERLQEHFNKSLRYRLKKLLAFLIKR